MFLQAPTLAAQTFRDFAVLEAWTRNRGIDGTYDGEGPGILYAGGHVRRAQSSPSAATSRVRRSRPNLIRYPLSAENLVGQRYCTRSIAHAALIARSLGDT